jgi:hypothetical protein
MLNFKVNSSYHYNFKKKNETKGKKLVALMRGYNKQEVHLTLISFSPDSFQVPRSEYSPKTEIG